MNNTWTTILSLVAIQSDDQSIAVWNVMRIQSESLIKQSRLSTTMCQVLI